MKNEDSILLEAFAIAGYRSFGEQPQRFEQLAKINLLIGQNNSGKSNILRLLNDVIPDFAGGNRHIHSNKRWSMSTLDAHMPTHPPFKIGIPLTISSNELGDQIKDQEDFVKQIRKNNQLKSLIDILKEKSRLDETENAWFYFDASNKLLYENWEKAFRAIGQNTLETLWHVLTGTMGGSWEQHWFPETLRRIAPCIKEVRTVMIPAIRQVGNKGSISDNFDGEGIIERLVKLQNPDVHNQKDKQKFENINRFLQIVTGNKSARIEIPHERDTILVHMDGKTLPLESLGTGIHEVIILASAATILESHLVCMEEPEIHLNPILQKKLVRYLTNNTSNQYFISTHSAALMDTPDAEIYHISLRDGQSIVERVTSDRHRSAVCEDLGYHPSDLLQANCVIWVEGPSDRIYLNYWLKSLAPHCIEGIHYSIMFYGGRLASHLSGEDIDEMDGAIQDFISLRRLNRRGVILIDSDRAKKSDSINKTKLRLIEEFNKGPGYAWVTEGREIENYLPVEQIKFAIAKVHPNATPLSRFRQFDNYLEIKTNSGKKVQATKTAVAKQIIETYETPDFTIHDLNISLLKLVNFINESNPGLEAPLVQS